MTNEERKVFELALEALQDYVDEHGPWSDDSGAQYVLRVGKEALAQPEQEPVANVVLRDGLPTLLANNQIKPTDERLYTTPPQPEKPDQDEVDIRSRLYQRIHELETQLAQPEQEPTEIGCSECGIGGGHALYCVRCAEKFVDAVEAAHGIKE